MKGDAYHIINRGVEKRKIFLDKEDFFRFRDNLYDFNTTALSPMSHSDRQKFNSAIRNRKPGDELVEILCVCLMPNHFHILVSEKIDGGAGLFLKKVLSGYTQFFNLKYKRKGVLFQGKTKKILVKKEGHFMLLPYYILSNPINLIEPKWKKQGLKNKKGVLMFLDEYKWSSFRDLSSCEAGIFSKIVNKELFFNLFGFNKQEKFLNFFVEWLENAYKE